MNEVNWSKTPIEEQKLHPRFWFVPWSSHRRVNVTTSSLLAFQHDNLSSAWLFRTSCLQLDSIASEVICHSQSKFVRRPRLLVDVVMLWQLMVGMQHTSSNLTNGRCYQKEQRGARSHGRGCYFEQRTGHLFDCVKKKCVGTGCSVWEETIIQWIFTCICRPYEKYHSN